MNITGKQQKITYLMVVLIIGILAGISLLRGMENAIGRTDSGMSIDFHGYWGPAQAFIQGNDPYAAVLSDTLPTLAISQGLPNTPANSPLMLVILSSLAFLPWPAARFVWALANVLLGLLIPWMAMRLMPYKVNGWALILFELVFFAMLPTRNVIGNGQTSLFVLAATLLAVGIARDRPWLAGVLLGIAISKYSLTFLVMIWFLMYGYFTATMVAVGMQVAGLLIISLASATSPFIILKEYFQIASPHIAILGDLDLRSLGIRLGATPGAIILSIIFVSIATILPLVSYNLASKWQYVISRQDDRTVQLSVLAILLTLPLLLVYHAVYDGIVLIILPVVMVAIWRNKSELALRAASPKAALGLPATVVVMVLILLMLPNFIAIKIWPGWDNIYPLIIGVDGIIAWASSLWLFEISENSKMTMVNYQ